MNGPPTVTGAADEWHIDSVATNAAAELQKLGGARVILATAPSSKAMSALVDGLGANGRISIPAAYRHELGLRPGDELLIQLEE